MSVTYPEYKYSDFPNQLDKQMEIRDPSASEISLIQQQNALISAGQKAAATELMAKNPTLEEAQMNAEKLLRIHHSILTLQKFFYDEVQNRIHRIGSDKGDWTAEMSSDSIDDTMRLNMFDIVRYPIHGIKQYFMAIRSDIPAGTLPTDIDYFIQMSIKGDKGDKPIKGVDYFDGENGTGLTPCGVWNANRTYSKYDMVSYDGDLYYLISEDSVNEVPKDSDFWEKINIDAKFYVGNDEPDDMIDNSVWIKTNDINLKEISFYIKNSTSVSEFYPKTKEQYIVDDVGFNLQEKLYHLYFNRPDVIVDITIDDDMKVYSKIAKLSDTNIIVAKYIIKDTIDIDSKIISELNIYDEAGTICLYNIIEETVESQNADNTVSYSTSRYIK